MKKDSKWTIAATKMYTHNGIIPPWSCPASQKAFADRDAGKIFLVLDREEKDGKVYQYLMSHPRSDYVAPADDYDKIAKQIVAMRGEGHGRGVIMERFPNVPRDFIASVIAKDKHKRGM